MKKDEKSNLIYPELSYKIIGCCLKVHSSLGSHYQEKYYQRALEIEFNKQNICYEKELKAELMYDNESIGRYFLDFLIDKKIILELKVKEQITKKDIGQVLRYLCKNNLKLGIIVNFGNEKLESERIVNNKFAINSRL